MSEGSVSWDDMRIMSRAIRLAKKHLPSPNPRVGAVVVKDGVIVGQGAHVKAGGPHAEVVALDNAGDSARGSCMYVTLEPCSHHGRTGPCAKAVIEAGIRRVVIGCIDPNPAVQGKGLQMLEDAGLETVVGVREDECVRLIAGHARFVNEGLPFVTWKYAMSLDGKIAAETGASRWVTGDLARREAHRLRKDSDAVVVGSGTQKADDPALTVRNVPTRRQPYRVVLDSQASLSIDSAVLKPKDGKVIVMVAESAPEANRQALTKAGANVVIAGRDKVDAEWALRILARDFDAREVMLESGPELAASLLEKNLVSEIVCFISGKLFGGEKAPSPLGSIGVASPDSAPIAEITRVKRFGSDIAVYARL